MLGKLLKYEIKATGRIFLPLYLGLMVVSVLASFTLQSDNWIINLLSGLLLGALYCALIVVTIALLIQRFYTNLLKDEGYLMFTLPVTPSILITSKLIATCMWCVLSLVIGAAAGLIVSWGFNGMEEIMSELHAAFPDFSLSAIPALVIILFFTAALSQIIFGILQIYFSLAVGQLPPFGRFKILAAVVTYLVTSFVVQFAAMAVFMAFGVYYAIRFESIINLEKTVDSSYIGIINSPDGSMQLMIADESARILSSMPEVWTLLNEFFAYAAAFNLVFAAAAFVGTSLILKKKLNLE